MTTFMETAMCPQGHVFKIRRRTQNTGFKVGTKCKVCSVQFEAIGGPVPLRALTEAGHGKPTRESHVEDRLVKRVGECGGEVRKVKWIGRRSAPDRLVMLPARDPLTVGDLCDYFHVPRSVANVVLTHTPQDDLPGRAIWVELKAPGMAAKFPSNAHERAQHREHERMRKMGQVVVVIDSYEQIEELLK